MLQNLIDSGREAQRTGAWDEALAHYESALALLADGSDPTKESEVLRRIGTVNAERGNLDEAYRSHQKSLEVAEAAGLEGSKNTALVALANVELLRANLEGAADLYLQAREVADRLENERLVAVIDTNLGVIA